LLSTYALSTIISDNVHLRREETAKEDITDFQLGEELSTKQIIDRAAACGLKDKNQLCNENG